MAIATFEDIWQKKEELGKVPSFDEIWQTSPVRLDKKSPQFKEYALSSEGAKEVAASAPEIAAKIAAKETPSRNDLKELGISGWNAEERNQLASLFRDASVAPRAFRGAGAGMTYPYTPGEGPAAPDERIGFGEALKHQFETPMKAEQTLIPLGGEFLKILESKPARDSLARLQSGWDYNKYVVKPHAGSRMTGFEKFPGTKVTKEGDIQRVQQWMDKQAVEMERQERGYTFGGRVGQGVSVLPKYMMEFAMTGGFARLGQKTGQRLVLRLFGDRVPQNVLRQIWRASGWASRALVRGTIGFSPNIAAKTIERTMPKQVHLDDEGKLVIDVAGETTPTALLKAWGEVVIEAAGEETGEAIVGMLPFGKKLTNALGKAWIAKFGGTTDDFMSAMLKKGGYSSFIGELGEEDVTRLLNYATGIQGKGKLKERLAQGLQESLNNKGVEAVVLAVPITGRVAVGMLGKAIAAEAEKEAEPAAAEVTPEKRQQAIDYVKGVLSQEQYAALDEKAKIEIGQRMLAEQGVEVEAEELAETPTTVPIPEPTEAVAGREAAEGVEIHPEPTVLKPGLEKPKTPIEKAMVQQMNEMAEAQPPAKEALAKAPEVPTEPEVKIEGTTKEKIAEWRTEQLKDAGGAGWDISVIEKTTKQYNKADTFLKNHPWIASDKLPQYLKKQIAQDMGPKGMVKWMWDKTGMTHYARLEEPTSADLLNEEQMDLLEKRGKQVVAPKAEKVVAPEVEKEIEYEEEAITEPTPSPKVEPGKAGKIVPTGKLDPTNPKEALEIIRLHKQSGGGVGGIFEQKWDAEFTYLEGRKGGYVVTSVEYTPEQVDTAYRTVQKPIESPMPDTDLFAMPGKEAQMKAIAQKMAKVKGVVKPKKMGPKALTKPSALPKAKTEKADHVKAVFSIAPKESTRYALNGVKVEGDIIVATDGRRLFWAKGKWGEDGLYLDVASLKKGSLGKPTKEEVNFPKWRDIIPDVSERDAIIVPSSGVYEDLDTVYRRIRQADLVTSEESRGITIIENKDGSLGFAAAAPEVGHVEINVNPGGRILGAVNPQFLMDVFKYHALRGDTAFEFYFTNFDRPILTRSLDGKTNTLTMPINPGEPSKAIKEAISELPIKTEPAEKPKSKGKKEPAEKEAPTEEPPEVSYTEEEDIGGVSGEAYAYEYQSEAPGPGEPTKPQPEQRNASDNTVFNLLELVELARALNEGKLPKVIKALRAARGKALGYFQHDKIKGKIKLRYDIFIGPVIKSVLVRPAAADAVQERIMWELTNLGEKIPEDQISVRRERDTKTGKTRITFYRKDPNFAARVLAHEIGHLADWLPEKDLGRGNILGRIASLKKFLEKQMAGWPGGPGPLTAADKKRLRIIAKDMLKRTYEIEVDEVIIKRFDITPDDVLAIWNSTMDQRKIAPELYNYIANMSRAEKKSIMAEALKARAGKGQLRDELQQFSKEIKEKTGRKIKQVVGGEVSPEKLAEKYRELFTEELRKRNLLYSDQINEELKALTRWWSPFSPTENKKYTDYRYKSSELYAEAISVLLNNPVALQAKAPEFYRGFFNWLENKPEMKNLYFQITDDIKSGKLAKDTVLKMREAFREADRRHAEQLKRRGITLGTVAKGFSVALSDVHAVIKGATRPLRRSGELSPEKNPEYAIDSAVYSNAEHEAYLVKIKWKVSKRLSDANLSWEDFDEYLTHLRIINERGEMANPFGFTPITSQQRLDEMKEQFGAEKFGILENARKQFWQIRNDMVVKKAREADIFSDDLMNYIADNEYYATFEVVDYIDEKHGRGSGAKIYRQVGTLSPITGSATATLLKDASLMRAMNWNQAKRSTIEMLQEFYPDEVKTAEKAGKRFIESKDPDKRILLFMHKGEMQGYYVDKWKADAFNRTESHVMNATSLIFRILAAPVKAVFTGINPGFWTFNIKRDIDRAVKNLPQAGNWNWVKTAKNVPNSGLRSFLKLYRGSIKQAFQSVYGIPDPVVQKMLENRMLISVADYGGYTTENKMLDRLLTMYTGAKGGKWDSKITRPLIKAMHHFLRLGEAIERVPKIAAFKYIKEAYPDMPDAMVEDFIRTKAGSPSFLTKGTFTPITNSLILFSNPAIQGMKSDFEVWRDRPGEQAMNMTKYVWLPKTLMWLFSSGAATALLLWLHDDDEDNEQVKAARFLQRMFENVSEYDKCNYHCIPVGITEQGKTVYFRIPMDEGQRLFGGIAWKLLNAQNAGLKTPMMVLDYTADQMPGLHPGVKVALAAFDYLNGVNPYDRWRDRKAIPEHLFKARTKETHIAMAKWMANQLGAGIVYRFKTEEPDKVKTELEKVLGLPIIENIVGRWVKVSDRGRSEMVRDAVEDEKQRRAREILQLRKITDKKLRGEDLTSAEEAFAEENKKYIEQREKRAKVIKSGDVYEKQLMFAVTRKEKDAIQLKILEIEGPGFDLTPYIEDDIISKANTLSRPIPVRKKDRAQHLKDIEETLKWYKDRNVSKETIRKLFVPYLRKNIKTTKTKVDKMQRLNYRIRGL